MTTLVKKQAYLASSQLLTGLLTLLTTVYLAHILAVETYGALGVVISSCMIIYFFQSFGLNAAIVNNTIDKSQLNMLGIISIIIQLRIIVALFTFGLIFILSRYIRPLLNIPPEMGTYLVTYAMTLCFLEISTTINTSLVALDKTRVASLSRAIFQAITAITAIAASYLFGIEGYFNGLLLGSALNLFSQCLLILQFGKAEGAHFRKPNITSYKSTLTNVFLTSKTSYLTKLIYGIWFRAPVIVFSMLNQPQVSAAVFISLQLVERMRTIATSISPANSAHMNTILLTSKNKFKAEVAHNIRFLITIACMMFIGAIVFSPLIYTILFDSEYRSAYKIFSLLSLSSFAFIFVNYLGSSILYPLQHLDRLVPFHFISKLLGLTLFSLVARYFEPIYAIVVYAITEYFTVHFYLKRSREALDDKSFLGNKFVTSIMLAITISCGINMYF